MNVQGGHVSSRSGGRGFTWCDRAGLVRAVSARRVSAICTASAFKSSAGSRPKAFAVARIFTSPLSLSGMPRFAVAFSARRTSRLLAPWPATPAASERKRLRATIRSLSAPQTPFGDFGVMRHGPMLQIVQHVPQARRSSNATASGCKSTVCVLPFLAALFGDCPFASVKIDFAPPHASHFFTPLACQKEHLEHA